MGFYFMQKYASLIDYSNEVCKERSEEYNLILFGSYSEIQAGCSVSACTEEEEERRVVVLRSLLKEGKVLLLQKLTDAYRRSGDLETRRAPQFVNLQFQ